MSELVHQRARYQQFKKLLSAPALNNLYSHESGKAIDSFVPDDPQLIGQDGIQSVHFEESSVKRTHKLLRGQVDRIETMDGTRLYRSDGETAIFLWLVPIGPLLGFLIPWGTVKTISWIGAGFTGQAAPKA